jgi:serine/threonine protein kinase
MSRIKNKPKIEAFIQSEILALQKLKDKPHIINFIEVLKTVNNIYFVYEYCEGGTLEQLLA